MKRGVHSNLRSLCSALLVSSYSLASGDILIVDQSGASGHYHEIQPAIDAASDCDVLLIFPRPSLYESFSVDGKSLILIGQGPNPVRARGGEIENIPAGEYAALKGLKLSGFDPELFLHDDAGTVALFDCSTTGTAHIRRCEDVQIVRCSFQGRNGGVSDCYGFDGEWGLEIWESNVAIYDSESIGGDGGDVKDCFFSLGGSGGMGISIDAGFLFLSGSTSRGGDCGFASNGFGSDGAPGFGLKVGGAAVANVLNSTLVGGDCGYSESGWSGNVQFLDGSAPSFRVLRTEPLGTRARIEITGTAGDEAYLLLSDRSTFDQRIDTLRGVLHVDPPTWVALGMIPASGILDLSVQLPPPPHYFPGPDWRLQAMTKDPANVRTLSNPAIAYIQEPRLPR